MSRVKKNNNNEDNYNKPFPKLLSKLLDDDKLTTQSELADYVGVTRQAISLYKNGNSFPDINTFEKIVEFFALKKGLNYSYDYWLGLSDEPSQDVEVKSIYEKFGLTEKSQRHLETINQLEKMQKYLNKSNSIQKTNSTIDTINLLFSELEGSTRKISLIDYINSYINMCIDKNYIISIQTDGSLELYNKKDNIKSKGYITINAESQLDILLFKIQEKLAKMRKEKQEAEITETKK